MKNKKIQFIFLAAAMMLIINIKISKAQTSDFGFDSFEVKSIDALITTVYSIISGDAGDRDWNKFKALFLPDAKFISIKRDIKGKENYFNGGIDEYIESIKPVLEKNTYYEQETGRSVQKSDNIAQVFSMFESIMFENGTPGNLKGANSFQLIYKDNRWWIANVLWNSEYRNF